MTNKKKIPIALAIAVAIILCGIIFLVMDKTKNTNLAYKDHPDARIETGMFRSPDGRIVD